MAKKIEIDIEECIGCETCVELCPEFFAFDEDTEKAHVTQEEGDAECIDEAVGSCPAGCITHQ